MNKDILETLKTFEPLSIFIYGSQANQSQNLKSDFEIGIIFDDANYISRKEIKNKISNENYNIFPFKLNELKSFNIDTPFQKNIYIASLINGNAKTIYGKKIIENLKCPKISKKDLLMDTSFNLGYALTAVRLMKEKVYDLAYELLYKSLFFATRNLIYVKTKILLSGYVNIYKESKNICIPNEFRELLDMGIQLRNNQLLKIDESLFYRNISYINKFVIPSIENTPMKTNN